MNATKNCILKSRPHVSFLRGSRNFFLVHDSHSNIVTSTEHVRGTVFLFCFADHKKLQSNGFRVNGKIK